MDPSKEVSASEKERKPAGEESEEASSTSSGMSSSSFLSASSRKSFWYLRTAQVTGKRTRTLAVPSLLLTTLEEMNPQELKTFQSFLTSGLLPDCPPIPESQLENADRQVTVDQMVKTYGPERAVEITLRILRGMKRVDLAEKLETDHRGGNRTRMYINLYITITVQWRYCLNLSPALIPTRPRSVLSPRMLAVPALLLTTLEEMNPHDLKTFQSFLTSGLLPDCPPIPESQLENADRQVTVDQMVKTYGPERAVEITLRILRGMKRVDLAEKLETDHRGNRTRMYINLYITITVQWSCLIWKMNQNDLAEKLERDQRSTASTSPLCGYPPRPPFFYPGSSEEVLSLTSAGSSGNFISQVQPQPLICPYSHQAPNYLFPRTLAVPSLLLTTLEEMNPQELKTFQSFLTSGLLPDCPPIPESQLENADRQVTVDQMVKTYGPERAVEITLRILRGMKRVDLAEKLETDHRGGSGSNLRQLSSQEEAASEMERKPAGEESEELPSTSSGMYSLNLSSVLIPTRPRTIFSQCGYPPGPPPPSFLPHLGSFSGSSGQLRSQRPQILSGSALLLTTPEELTEEQLTNDELLSVLSIPESQLENADIQVTVDQMERYDSLRAMETTETSDRYHSRGKKRRTNEPPSWPVLVSRNKKSEEDCVPLTDGAPPIIKHKETPKLEMDCPPILDIPLEMANSVNTEVAVNTQENTQRMDEELGRERGSPLLLEHHHMSSPDEFTPEIHDQDNRREYQFLCPSAGLFQCSITGLVFRMEGEGEVLYRTVPWDRRLLAQSGKRPAGPLFRLTCLKGSVCQLHLPHCEIYNSGLPCDFLSVAHVTDENMEFIRPHKITETHVIIKIRGFSAYGDVKDEDSPTVPIRALVLLFYKPPVVPKKRSILNVLLLPRNVVIREVQEEWIRRNEDRNIYIETNSHCQLTPNQEYNLSTDLTDEYLIKPMDAEFVDFESYENYIPTFQLFIQTVVEEVNLLLKENGGVVSVWDRLVWLPVSAVSPAAPPANHSTLPGRGFIRNHRMALETRLGLLQPLFLRLQDRGVLIDEEREEVVSKSTKTQQNQALLDMVVRKGDEAQEEFYQVLREADHFLVKDLEKKKA
ncbi:unnamed protein product [Coregonus sp. 'balchen']|nr:unnamed protein product [Coregonus sp. 'balchen']